MNITETNEQPIELTEILSLAQGVSYDQESITLQGCYHDEISAYRARKVWREVLEDNFLLEYEYDFYSVIKSHEPISTYLLTCRFTTACARYAFWRLTNNQVPEAQYLIETAHIPHCDSRAQELMLAPDLRPTRSENFVPEKLGQGLGATRASDEITARLGELLSWLKSKICLL